MKANTTELIKFKKLVRRLNYTTHGTAGLLTMMWLGVGKNCPMGDIGRFSNEEIAILMDWDKDPDQLVAALVECGWLDPHEEYRLVVHDWLDHCPNYVRGNIARARKGMIKDTNYSNDSSGAESALNQGPECSSADVTDIPVATIEGSPEASCDMPTKSSLVKSSLVKPNPTTELRSWEGVEERLVELGLGRRSTVMAHLRSCGSEPFKIDQILGVWESRKSAFTKPQGALYERLMNEHPGMAADTGWVAPLQRDTGQRKVRDRTTEFEMQRAHLVKQLRAEGKDEEHIETAVAKLAARLKEKSHAT